MLALDYGSARCGCAISDPTGTVVTPIETIERPATKRGMARLRALVAAREPQLVLVGLPLSLSGADTAQTRETREFARRLAEQLSDPAASTPPVPVELYDERFTTRLAQRGTEGPGRPRAAEDSRAAAHLLESFLAAGSR